MTNSIHIFCIIDNSLRLMSDYSRTPMLLVTLFSIHFIRKCIMRMAFLFYSLTLLHSTQNKWFLLQIIASKAGEEASFGVGNYIV